MSRQLFIRYLKSRSKTDTFRFYVYAYLRTKNSSTGNKGIPYYIGKGCSKRAWDTHRKIPVPKDKSNIVIIAYDLSEVGSLALERRYIEWYGRKDIGTGILINLTDGGEGFSGRKWSEDQRKARSGKNSPLHGKTHSTDRREKQSISKTGTKQSEEHIRNISEGRKKKIQIECIETEEVFDGPSYVTDWLKCQGFVKALSGNINNCCRGIYKSAYGYRWKYV